MLELGGFVELPALRGCPLRGGLAYQGGPQKMFACRSERSKLITTVWAANNPFDVTQCSVSESLSRLYVLAIRTLFCLIRKAVKNLPLFVWQNSDFPNLESGQQFCHFSAARLIPLHVRCVMSDKGPSTTWLSMWLSMCRDSNPDLWKRGKWVVIKSRALESRGYEESRIAALTHTHIAGEKSHTTLSSIF